MFFAYVNYFIWVSLHLSGSLYVDNTSTTKEIVLMAGQYDMEIEFIRCVYDEIRVKASGLEFRQISRAGTILEKYTECTMVREKVVRVVTVPETREYNFEFIGTGSLSYKFVRTDEIYPDQMKDEYLSYLDKMDKQKSI